LFNISVPADLDTKGLPREPFERRRVPRGRPQLQLRVAGGPHLEQIVVAAIVQLQPADGLRVAAVQALGKSQDRGQRANGSPHAAPQAAKAIVAALRRGLAVIARHKRDRFDLVGLEPPKVAVPDQIV
jgi:hypothetical protein